MILIDHFNVVAAAKAFLVDHGENAAVSVITRNPRRWRWRSAP